ncbi:MAG: DUF4876 domain-containing protein [Bacteroides cellulosilyticus]
MNLCIFRKEIIPGKSLIRKSAASTNGHFIYQDTNNAAEDFIVSEPSLKK